MLKYESQENKDFHSWPPRLLGEMFNPSTGLRVNAEPSRSIKN